MKLMIRKAMRDLTGDYRRLILSLAAMLVGMVAFGVIFFSYEMIDRELTEEFAAINPASAMIEVNVIDDELRELTAGFAGIEYFEERAFYELRVQTGENQWKKLELHSAANFGDLRLNMVQPEFGSYDPAVGELLIERNAAGVAGAGIGDFLTMADARGNEWTCRITGVVADIYQHPASIHNSVYAYVSDNMLQEMGMNLNIITYMVADTPYDREAILAVSNEYIKLLEASGYTVVRLEVPETPGVSMHYEEYVSTLFLLQVFTVVMLLFGCMIMSGLISSIMSGQIRQIGILKAVGSSTNKIMAAYQLAFMSLIAMTAAVSIPLVRLSANGFVKLTMGISNMKPENLSVPWYFYLIYIVFAVAVPLVGVWLPVRRGIKISVRDALMESGPAGHSFRWSFPEIRVISRPVLLSIRNAMRKKQRFLRNTVILSLGGALFTAVVTAMLATGTTLERNLDSLGFDYQVMTGSAKTEDEIRAVAAKLSSVRAYEVWGVAAAQLMQDNGSSGKSYPVYAPQNGSRMMVPDLLSGQWIEEGDGQGIVVGHKFLVSHPQYRLGSAVALQIGGQIREFELTGVIKDMGDAAIYMSHEAYQEYVDPAQQLSSLKLVLEYSGRPKAVHTLLESELKEMGVGILSGQSRSDLYEVWSGHFAVTLQTFTFIILMLVTVAGFGLAATMNAQASERIREIGIMKAMGASHRQINRIVTSESIFISVISWLISVIIGIPLSVAGIFIFGNRIINTPLNTDVSSFAAAFMIWFVLILGIGYLASRSAAKQAVKRKVGLCLKSEG